MRSTWSYALGLVSLTVLTISIYFELHPFLFVGLYITAGGTSLIALRLLRNTPPSPKLTVRVVTISALFFLLLLPSTPRFDDDLYRYVWDGKVTWERGHPYGIAPSDYRILHLRDADFSRIGFRDLPTIYPPVAEFFFAVSALFGDFARHAWKSLLFLAHVLLCFWLARLLSRRRLHPAWLVAYAWNPLILKEFANSGHVDLLGALFMMIAFIPATDGRIRVASLFCAGGIKPVGWLAIPFVWNDVSPLIRRSCVALILLGIVAIPSVPPSWWEGLTLFTHQWTYAPFLFEPIRGLGRAIHIDDSWIRVWALLPALLALVYSRLKRLPFSQAWEIVGVAWLLFSPTINPWYLVWLLPVWILERRLYGLAATILVPTSYVFYANLEDLPHLTWTTFALIVLTAFWEWRRRAKTALTS